jgi:hypothetical protein
MSEQLITFVCFTHVQTKFLIHIDDLPYWPRFTKWKISVHRIAHELSGGFFHLILNSKAYVAVWVVGAIKCTDIIIIRGLNKTLNKPI